MGNENVYATKQECQKKCGGGKAIFKQKQYFRITSHCIPQNFLDDSNYYCKLLLA